jgi:hypothetical protein
MDPVSKLGRFLVVGPSLLGFFLIAGCGTNPGGVETATSPTGEAQKVAPRYQKIMDAKSKAPVPKK